MSEDLSFVSPALMKKLLHLHFKDEKTKATSEAVKMCAKLMEVFIQGNVHRRIFTER